MQLSHWEQDAMMRAHCIVIGAGLIGLQTALALRERLPGQRIVVLERGILPAGASSRNAGFACFGSLTEILADIDATGIDAALGLIEQRWQGLALLRDLIGDGAMDYQALGGHDLIRHAEQPALERLDAVNDLLRPLFGDAVFAVDDRSLAASGFGPGVLALVSNRFEGQLHSGRAMNGLKRLALQNGIEIINGARVERLEEDGSGVDVVIAGGACLRADRVAVCNNALIPALLPSVPIVPGRGQVIVTEPLPDLPFRGCYHVDRGFYYFRNIGNRVLLGGGRNLDIAGETSTEMIVTQPIQQALEAMLTGLILPGRQWRIESRWAGLMGFTGDKQPLVRRVGERMVAGFGCNGMGVALSPLVARQTAAMLLDGQAP